MSTFPPCQRRRNQSEASELKKECWVLSFGLACVVTFLTTILCFSLFVIICSYVFLCFIIIIYVVYIFFYYFFIFFHIFFIYFYIFSLCFVIFSYVGTCCGEHTSGEGASPDKWKWLQHVSRHVISCFFLFIVFQTMSQKLVSAELTQGSHSGFQLAAQEPQGGEGPPLGGRVLPETERERGVNRDRLDPPRASLTYNWPEVSLRFN